MTTDRDEKPAVSGAEVLTLPPRAIDPPKRVTVDFAALRRALVASSAAAGALHACAVELRSRGMWH